MDYQQITEKEKPSYFIPNYPSLKSSDDVGRAAVNGQIIEYPRVVRRDCDPSISGQKFGNMSFIIFDKPAIFREKPVYGLVKLRGNYESVDVCHAEASKIVREVDSKFQVRIAPVGEWVPITENDIVVKEIYDIRESDKEIHLRDDAIKSKEKENNKKMKEIREAEEKCKNEPDIYDDQESLKFYAMKRVTAMKLEENLQIQISKIKEQQKKLAEQQILLKKLEQKYHTYNSEWISLYNSEREKTSLPKFIPGETQFDEYNSTTLAELVEKYPEFK